MDWEEICQHTLCVRSSVPTQVIMEVGNRSDDVLVIPLSFSSLLTSFSSSHSSDSYCPLPHFLLFLSQTWSQHGQKGGQRPETFFFFFWKEMHWFLERNSSTLWSLLFSPHTDWFQLQLQFQIQLQCSLFTLLTEIYIFCYLEFKIILDKKILWTLWCKA